MFKRKVVFKLDWNFFVSSATTVASLGLLFYEKRSTNIRENQRIELQKTELAYKYKIDCYSELVSLFLKQDDENTDASIQKLHLLTARAKMICEKETDEALTCLIKEIDNRSLENRKKFSGSYLNAIANCVNAFSREVKNFKK